MRVCACTTKEKLHYIKQRKKKKTPYHGINTALLLTECHAVKWALRNVSEEYSSNQTHFRSFVSEWVKHFLTWQKQLFSVWATQAWICNKRRMFLKFLPRQYSCVTTVTISFFLLERWICSVQFAFKGLVSRSYQRLQYSTRRDQCHTQKMGWTKLHRCPALITRRNTYLISYIRYHICILKVFQ